MPMMKNAIGILASALVAAATAGAAQAADQGLYLRAEVGGSFPADLDGGNWLDPSDTGLGGDLDSGFVLGGGVGYRFTPSVRAEAVIGWRGGFDFKHDVSDRFGNSGTTDSGAKVLTGMVNVYYDLPVDFPVKPYVGLGVGVARTKLDGVTYTLNGGYLDREDSNSETNFAWAVMGGVSYEVTSSVALDLGYRYLDAGDIKTSGRFASGATLPALKSELSLHEVVATVRFQF